ncbi:hypothetical protein GCM10010149_10620 [Nonomuraea roseoviolacea subsp. roseoviolacea]
MMNNRDLRSRRFGGSADRDEVDEYLRMVVEYLQGRGAPIATEDMFSKSFSWAVREPGYDSSDVSCLIAQVAREIDRLVRQVYGRVART